MRILMLTSVYRDETLGLKDPSTNIVNSFVKEWKKQGNDVLVIHNSHCYPRIFYAIPSKIKQTLSSKMGFAILDYRVIQKKIYVSSGVKVFRLPIKKIIPHMRPGKYTIKKQVQRIADILEAEKFIPDVMVGHWASPQMEIISELKKIYPCKTAVILHGLSYITAPGFDVNKYLKNIDILGARSLTQAKQIQEILHLSKMPFVCNSGVPDEYLDAYNINLDKFRNIKKLEITYVGRLVSYKNVDATIRALAQIKEVNWKFNIVGDGATRAALEKLAKESDCDDKIRFWGWVSREEVMKILEDTHIFVMISTNEIFGLVYLEAMAASCITIASKGGGVDGIIVNGENGYLCQEGNDMELLAILKAIEKKSFSDIANIVRKGYMTAEEYKDSNVAKKYLDNIVK